ncbi:hypothetical protein GCM10011409_00350 [Lentibacillus populi]|uniref:WYL domain-containing protein n=1 Tax=Lentibacillus populi TaxID=1827502 RepID=A0A9W5TTZ8_9BACI|nr:hypothetical protein [Lentibacillus populi]GGB27001.1 hypothetical protein GCM10011409_00350 [Lentibacillus populi]
MSIKPGSNLEMIYLDSNNKITQRTIKVLQTNSDTILAYCYSKRQVRSFKVNNILSFLPKRMGA